MAFVASCTKNSTFALRTKLYLENTNISILWQVVRFITVRAMQSIGSSLDVLHISTTFTASEDENSFLERSLLHPTHQNWKIPDLERAFPESANGVNETSNKLSMSSMFFVKNWYFFLNNFRTSPNTFRKSASPRAIRFSCSSIFDLVVGSTNSLSICKR